MYELTERLLAAAKSVRAFGQLVQRGYRDSLSGDMEWLTTRKGELKIPPGQRKDTVWAKVAGQRPAWARKGEHLSALAMMKRLWPSRFRQWIEEAGLELDVQRYVVSTHTMALASSLEKLLEEKIENGEALQKLFEHAKDLETVALPRCLMRKVHECPDPVRAHLARRLPALLEKLRENEEGELNPQAKEKALRLREATENLVNDALGNKPERYYALILMDGDNMGAWLAGNEEQYQLTFREAWHSRFRSGIEPFTQGNDRLKDYLHERRPASPARHMAISSALNGFALDLARHIVEDLCKGKLIYAGGDDVLAMVSIDDLTRCLWLLRLAYSGAMPERQEQFFGHLDLEMKNGFVLWEKGRKDRRFYRVMGEKATASAGAVVAHHTAPLGAVLRELRSAEKAAKALAGKNAFSLRLLKRAGGKVELTLPWSLKPAGEFEALAESPMSALVNLQRTLAGDLSRRMAYLSDVWLERLPADSKDLEKLLSTNLAYQFGRQGGGDSQQAEHLAHVAVTVGQDGTKTIETLRNMLAVAEFLAREGRASAHDETSPGKETAHG